MRNYNQRGKIDYYSRDLVFTTDIKFISIHWCFHKGCQSEILLGQTSLHVISSWSLIDFIFTVPMQIVFTPYPHLGSSFAHYASSRVDSVDCPMINWQFLNSTLLHIFLIPPKTNCWISSRNYFFSQCKQQVTSPYSLLVVFVYLFHLATQICLPSHFIFSLLLRKWADNGGGRSTIDKEKSRQSTGVKALCQTPCG